MPSNYESLLWQVDGHVATVTLNRPEKKNAMSRVMFDEIKAVFDRASAEPGIRCLVVTGAGGAFCSGADLGDPENLVGTSFEARDRMNVVHDVVSSVVNCRVPTIAKVTGIAAGAGCNLAFCCDLIVATRSAAFAELFVKRGLVVDFGGSWALTRLLPLSRAKELAFLGDTLSADDADKLGILNRLCDDDEVDAVVKDLSQRLAALPPRTVSLIKENLNHAADAGLHSTLERESSSQSLLLMSEDTREAVTAWVEKREPRFTGR